MNQSRPFRVAVAGLQYETNTFAPGDATADLFHAPGWDYGPAVLAGGDGLSCVSGAVALAKESNVELFGTTSTGMRSGPLFRAGEFYKLKARLLSGLAPFAGAVDGVYLSLHGAMVCADEDDAEGDLIWAVRDLMKVPVAVSLDLHAHFTDRMAQGTPLIAGYHTLPHLDQHETGRRALSLLIRKLHGSNPTLAWTRIPMLTSAEGQDTNKEPIRSILQRIEEMTAEPGVLDGSLYMTQPWLDVPDLGWTAVVVTDDDPELASRYSRELAEMAWERRTRVVAPKVSIADAMKRVSSASHRPDLGPFVLSDGGDSPSAGAAGDGAELVAALASTDLPGPAIAVVADASAAAACHAAGVGARVTLPLGGATTPALFRPFPAEGVVRSLLDTTYQSRYPPCVVDPGRTAVLEFDNGTSAIITEIAVGQLDLEPFRHAGFEPSDAHVVVVKSAGGYRGYFEPIARECIDVATSGPADSRIELMPFERITRPLYPFDTDFEWTPRTDVSTG